MEASLKFDKRVRTIARKNRRIARGHTTYIDSMGIVRKKSVKRGPHIPFRGLFTIALGFCLFKAVVLASAGSKVYDTRLDGMLGGTAFEQAGAWALQIDPVTRFMAGIIGIVV